MWLDETLFDQDERYGVMNRNASRCGAPLERCVISFRLHVPRPPLIALGSILFIVLSFLSTDRFNNDCRTCILLVLAYLL